MSDSAILGTTSHPNINIPRAHHWPTPWVFGVLVLPLGVYVGYFSTALPFLLSRSGVPVDEIARIGSLLYVPPILMFLWTPIVDVKLLRRTWLILGASVTAICLLAASQLLGPSHLRLLMLILFFGGCVVALVAASCGGLMATMLSASAQSKAAGWNQAGNFGGGVLGAALVLWLVEHVSLSAVGVAAAALVLLPALVAFTVPEAPPSPSPWFRGRFTEIRREALAVLRSPKAAMGSPSSNCPWKYMRSVLPASRTRLVLRRGRERRDLDQRYWRRCRSGTGIAVQRIGTRQLGPPLQLRVIWYEQCAGCDCPADGVSAIRILLGHLALA